MYCILRFANANAANVSWKPLFPIVAAVIAVAIGVRFILKWKGSSRSASCRGLTCLLPIGTVLVYLRTVALLSEWLEDRARCRSM